MTRERRPGGQALASAAGLLTIGMISAATVGQGCLSSAPVSTDGNDDGGAPGEGGSTSVLNGMGGDPSGGSTNGPTTSTGVDPGPCPDGATCIANFPFGEMRNTNDEPADAIDSYDCAPDTNEQGKEVYYRVTVPSDGFLSAAVYVSEGVDIDVHILTSFDPASPSGTTCVSRGDHQAKADVTAGDYWVIADTWSNAGGTDFPGAFKIDIGFVPLSEGPCGMDAAPMSRVGDGGDALPMPATGPVALEAHLVTQEESKPYPQSSTEKLAEHYALSQAKTGLVMFRDQVWAPKEGGGQFFGAGIDDPAEFPVVDEGWYVNMYWTPASRPAKGTKMILRKPDDPSRAVVVAAGYETGPGDLSFVGGTPEETHFYLGSEHGTPLTIGISKDQAVPFGPRKCTD